MGGDFGPRVTIPAAVQVAQAFPDLTLVLVGDQALLQQQLTSLNISSDSGPLADKLRILHAEDTVGMNDKPAQVLRRKQQSSMWKAVELVRDGSVDACVSAGNTGALVALGKFLLKTFPGIDRPAICKPIPRGNGHSYMLDLGANVSCSSEQLLQFAVMGTVLASAVDGVDRPTVGLLNIGEEAIKGNEQVKLAASLLDEHDQLNYVGYVEGDGIYSGAADVIVCDGFAGNVALKASEGVARLLAGTLSETFKGTWYSRLVGMIARPLLLKWHEQFDPGRYNGASFLGLQGTLIKSHGGADSNSFACALTMAKDQVDKQIPQRINEQFALLSL